MNVEELFNSANQNKFSYVLMLPLGDELLEQHLTKWLEQRVNLVKTSSKHPEELVAMFERSDYVLCTYDALKCVTDTNKNVFLNVHTDDVDIINQSNIFVFDPFRNEDKTNLDYSSVLDIATECLQQDLDNKWIPYYEV